MAERWIVARLWHQIFYSLFVFNDRIRELLDELKNRAASAESAPGRH